MPERTMLFVDGNNWYHGLRALGLAGVRRLDYARISRKLVGPFRTWISTRYYVGQVVQSEAPDQYAAQRRFLSALPVRIDARVYRELAALAQRHRRVAVKVEKAVDVRIAVDMVSMA